jgi:outer membrane PBP1 activator LpoA protein
LWCALLLPVLLAGCGVGVGMHRELNGKEDKAVASDQDIEVMLHDAATLAQPARDEMRQQAAEKLTERGEMDRSLTLLFNIDPQNLSDTGFISYTLMYGRWAVEKDQRALAHNLLLNARVELLLPDADREQAIALHELRAQYLDADHQSARAVTERIAITPMLSNEEQADKNSASIWKSLQPMSREEIQALERRPGGELDGWLELMHIAMAQELDIDAQASLLNDWLDRFPQHPAARHLPPELRSLQAVISQKPRRVTLLLPLSGNLQEAGEAIRDGFIAAYYQALGRHSAVPKIRIVDSQQDSDFLKLYDGIAADTDMVIGPLEKEKVALLQNRGHLPVPTLALNDAASREEQKTTENLYMFGLNPEDEARQVADEARRQGRTRALVIEPANDWGQRMGSAFVQEWQAQSGTALGTVMFDTEKADYSTVLQQALGITESKARKKQLRQWSGTPLEFEPRRRQDIDMIFLATRPDQARQIKPLLAFNYAGDIPLYATSSIYSGQPDVRKDADLNGVQLLVPPWFLEGSEFKETVNHDLSPDAALQPLYAFGADAWRLHARLMVLAMSQQSRLQGYTGLLHMDAHQRICREQIWALMEQGKITAVAPTP